MDEREKQMRLELIGILGEIIEMFYSDLPHAVCLEQTDYKIGEFIKKYDLDIPAYRERMKRKNNEPSK